MRENNEHVAIIKPWSGGFNQYSLYITIPSRIVKKIGITKDSVLSVGIADDSIITITKTTNGKTKKKLPSKIQSYKIEPNTDEPTIEKDFKNPLDKLDNI